MEKEGKEAKEGGGRGAERSKMLILSRMSASSLTLLKMSCLHSRIPKDAVAHMACPWENLLSSGSESIGPASPPTIFSFLS